MDFYFIFAYFVVGFFIANIGLSVWKKDNPKHHPVFTRKERFIMTIPWWPAAIIIYIFSLLGKYVDWVDSKKGGKE